MTLPTKKTGNVNNSSSCCREKACVSFGQKHKQDREVGIDCPRFGAAPQKRVVCRLLNNWPLPGNIQRVEICDAWPGTWQLLGLEPNSLTGTVMASFLGFILFLLRISFPSFAPSTIVCIRTYAELGEMLISKSN